MNHLTDRRFTVLIDGREFDNGDFREETLDKAKAILAEASGTHMTVTVVDHDDTLVGWFSNRRIQGRFNKQTWGGRKGDDALDAGTEEFDATNSVLLLPLDRIRELDDCSENTDEIGRELVQWDGPCSVYLVDSLMEFFGVLDADDITERYLEMAREQHQPQPQEEGVFTLTIQVKAVKSQGRTWQEVIDDLDYSVRSTTPGAVVRDTEVIDSNLVLSHTSS